MSSTTWAGIVQGRVDDACTKGPAVKEVPTSPKPDAPENDDFTIKAFNTEQKDNQQEQKPADNISNTLERKESLPKASQSLTPSPRTSRNGSLGSVTGTAGSVPAHQRLYEHGLAMRQKREEAAAKQNSELTFKPELSPRSRNLGPSNPASSGGAKAAVYERLSSAATETRMRLEKLRQERLEAERKTCTFTPKVNNYSEKLLTQRTSNLGGNNPHARQQAYLKKMNQTFGGSMMRTSGYGTQGVAQAGSASIGGSIRSRQLQQVLAQRKSLVGCEATPAMLTAAGPEFTEKMKKELRAAYGIKLREEAPLEEVERWYKASLKEEAEIEQAILEAREALLAESLKEVEEWWRAACEETEAAAGAIDFVSQPIPDLINLDDDDMSVITADHATSAVEIFTETTTLDNKAQITEGSDQIAAEISKIAEPEESKVAGVDKAAALTSEAAIELQEERLEQVKQLLDAKEEELMKEITQLDTALLEVKVLPAAPVDSQVTMLPEDDKDQNIKSEEKTVAGTSTTDAEIMSESDEEEPSEHLPTAKKAAVKYHTSRINAAISLQGSKTGSAIKMHSAKISKALKKSSSSSSSKILHHTSAIAAAIQKNGYKIAEVVGHHSTRIATLNKDTHAAAAVSENAAAFTADIQQIASNMTTTVQQISTSEADAKQKNAAVKGAIGAAAMKIAAAVREYAALTAATLGKHGNSIVAALQQLAARIVAALKSTASSIAAAMKRYQSSIAKTGRQLPRSRTVHAIA